MKEDKTEQKITDVTVVIPNYNGCSFLKDCLDSLRKNGTFPIIVVDNASTDGSCEFIRNEYPEVQLICNKANLGFSAAVNIGIRKAETEYVILLNNDTKVDSQFVVELKCGIQKSDRIFSCSSKMIQMRKPDLIDDTGDEYCALGWAFTCGKDKAAVKYNQQRNIFASCAGAAIYRKKIFERIGYFDEEHFAYLEDIDIGYRSQIYGYRNVYIPKAICYHVGSGASGSRYNAFKTVLSARNNVYLIYKNMPFFFWLLNLPFLIPGFLVKFLFFLKKGHASDYRKGIRQGIQLIFSMNGRMHKNRFKVHKIGNYCKIQLLLWRNLFRRFIKS